MNQIKNSKESFYITIATVVSITLIAIVIAPEGVDWFQEMIAKLPRA